MSVDRKGLNSWRQFIFRCLFNSLKNLDLLLACFIVSLSSFGLCMMALSAVDNLLDHHPSKTILKVQAKIGIQLLSLFI